MDEIKHTLRYHQDRIEQCLRGEDDKKFISEADLQGLWSEPALSNLFKKAGHPIGQDDVEYISKHALKSISLLVQLEWDGWKDCERILLRRTGHEPILDDSKLPLDEEFNFDTISLTKLQRQALPSIQSQLIQLKISQQSFKFWPAAYALPFEKSEMISEGRYGKVAAVEVAAGYFVYDDGQTNSTPLRLAHKLLQDKTYGERERQNLEALKSSLCKHDHILIHKAVFQCGDQYHILYDQATDHLGTFLNEKRFDDYFRTRRQLIRNLEEFTNLADALAFLHTQVNINNTRYACCHMDLKPDNILVFCQDKPLKFQISDLGISKLKPDPEHARSGFDVRPSLRDPTLNRSFRTLALTTKTYGSRGPGQFQAPEMRTSNKVGRSSDVWSLGCILIVYLIRIIEDRGALKRFQLELAGRDSSDDYFHTGRAVKEQVKAWIERLTTSDRYLGRLSRSIVEELQCLLSKSVVYSWRERISAIEFAQRLSDIVKLFRETNMETLLRPESLRTPDTTESKFFTSKLTSLGFATYRRIFDDCEVGDEVSFHYLEQCFQALIYPDELRRCWDVVTGPESFPARKDLDVHKTCALVFLIHLLIQKQITSSRLQDKTVAEIDHRGLTLIQQFAKWSDCHCGGIDPEKGCKVQWNFSAAKGLYRPENERANCKVASETIATEERKSLKRDLSKRWNEGRT